MREKCAYLDSQEIIELCSIQCRNEGSNLIEKFYVSAKVRFTVTRNLNGATIIVIKKEGSIVMHATCYKLAYPI